MRWNERAERWMAWMRLRDGSRRKPERVDKSDAQADLDELLALRPQSLDPPPQRVRLATFDEVIDDWFAAGCPNSTAPKRSRHARTKLPETLTNARLLLSSNVRPVIGHLWVDRTTTGRLEALFADMAKRGYATSTIDHNWNYLNQAPPSRFSPVTLAADGQLHAQHLGADDALARRRILDPAGAVDGFVLGVGGRCRSGPARAVAPLPSHSRGVRRRRVIGQGPALAVVGSADNVRRWYSTVSLPNIRMNATG